MRRLSLSWLFFALALLLTGAAVTGLVVRASQWTGAGSYAAPSAASADTGLDRDVQTHL
jgi:hypothetical protein